MIHPVVFSFQSCSGDLLSLSLEPRTWNNWKENNFCWMNLTFTKYYTIIFLLINFQAQKTSSFSFLQSTSGPIEINTKNDWWCRPKVDLSLKSRSWAPPSVLFRAQLPKDFKDNISAFGSTCKRNEDIVG